MSDIGKALRKLTPQQRALLELRLQQKKRGASKAETIKRRAPGAKVPLSYAQQRLWFLERLDPGRAAYNTPGAYRLEGSFDIRVLTKALEALVKRHEVLRARVVDPEQNGEPELVIDTPYRPSPFVIDLEALDEPSRRELVRHIARAEARRPFSLEAEPSFRVSLVRLAEEEHVLLVTLHHIISDGWSLGILLRELEALYEAFRTGAPSPLPELPVQYGDYALWQREWLSGDVLEKQLAYWREHLEGAPRLELPTDHPREVRPDYRGGRVDFALSPRLTGALEGLARNEGTTLFMVLLGGFAALLERYTGQPDVVIGSVIANRQRSELEGLIGLFANTLVLRTKVARDMTFKELLDRVRAVTLGAYEHQDLPIEKLVEALAPEGRLSGNPFFEVVFAFQNIPRPHARSAADRSGLVFRPVDGAGARTRFELTFELMQGAEGIVGAITYRRDLFRPERIEAMARHFETLLEAASEAPERRLYELPVLSDSEKEVAVASGNDTARAYPETSIHHVFETIARNRPEDIALVFGDTSWSYGELDRRANRFANHLIELGVRPESRVAVCLTRSAELVVALVGILKAGGVYVPLDPDYPEPRLRFMIDDTAPSAIVTETHLEAKLPGACAPVVCIDDADAEWDDADESSPNVEVSPDGLAYIAYTSGSTGAPKGVEVRHRGVVRLVTGVDYVRLGPGETHLLLAPIAFDASTFELWGALLTGGRLALYPEGVPTSEELGRAVDRHGVTTLWLTASLFNAVVDEAPAMLQGVRQLLVGGEALSVPHVQKATKELPATTLINGYGPTEGTTFTCCHRIPREMDEASGSVPIGVPIANTRVYLLDDQLEPVPEGLSGELVIGGDGLARGYRHDPVRTAEKFVPDPFSGTPGARLYRTGDRARRRADGSLDFLGRRDQQVKLHGFRIELGEIEAALQSHGGVARAAVLVTSSESGRRRLVGFVVPRSGTSTPDRLEIASLRSFLSRSLPGYMVPSQLVSLSSLPLTPNGKLDRDALLEQLPNKDAEAADVHVPPRGPVEEGLAAIWRDVLGCDGIGARDDFFHRGGQSLAAVRLVSRIRKLFGVDLPLRDVFEAPKLADLAARVEAARRTAVDMPLPDLIAAPSGADAPLSLAQRRLWLLDRLGLGGASYNVCGAVRLRGPLDQTALVASVSQIVRRHESLRTTFPADGLTQRAQSPDAFEVPVLSLEATAVERFLAEESERAFDLAEGPLFRCHLIEIGADDHVLVWNVHHIIADGWSVGVFFRELRAHYRAAVAQGGESDPLPPLPIQYGDYARWQRSVVDGARVERELDFWRRRLEEAPPPVELPVDRRRVPEGRPRGARLTRALPAELAASLRGFSRDMGATLFVTLFAGFHALVHRLTGAEDIIVGTPVANRGRSELEGLIGFFVNTLAVRVDLSERPSFKELVDRVRESVLASFDHLEMPFEKLVEELRPERKPHENPFFQSVFAFQNASSVELALEGIEVSPVPIELGTLRFDFELHVWERPSGLFTVVSYNADLYDRETVDLWLSRFESLLQHAAREPGRPISELRLASDVDLQDLARWNETRREYPREATLPELFEAVVARQGRAPALLLEDEVLDYAHLNRRANRLAQRLRTVGVEAETRVGVEAGRSFETVIALLAILKAGGAYVPVDPSYPTERVRFLLEDASATVLVASGDLASRCPSGVTLVDPTRELALTKEAVGADNDVRLEAATSSADAAAYVMYTSGSTGVPKGVSVSHRAVTRLLFGVDYVSLGPNRRVLQLAPVSFDASTFEIWGALLHGGALVLHPERVPSAAGLAATLRRHRVSTLWLTSSLFNALVDEDPSLFASAEELLVGGEALSLPHIQRAQRHCPNTRFVNGYGPTEGTTFTCCYRIPARIDERSVSVPIGGPIANTHVRVLDEALELVPPGVPGELFIGGDGLARGYWERPALTAERFVPDPHADAPGARLYRTGDVVTYLRDGTLRFLGRLDDQVKLRGFRVEPGEVASALSAHPEVREAAVVVDRDARGEKALIGYYVPRSGKAIDERELSTHLAARLPEHMVPARLLPLERLPLTRNGKLDRKALPSLPQPRSQGRTSDSIEIDLEPPSDALEARIAALWCEVLKVDRVGVLDNFFEIGGHSLLLLNLHRRLKEELHERARDLSTVDLFRYPTVRALATHLDGRRESSRVEVSGSHRETRSNGDDPIAIIGMAGRFPGAEDVDIFWKNIREGRESITFFGEEELLSEGLDPVECRHPRYIKARGIVDDAELFDAAFFGFTPREAEILDPQQRIFLETVWEALERAGYGGDHRGRVGVFAGATTNAYAARILSHPETARAAGRYAAFLNTDKDFLSTRVSYKLNLTGPSVTVQTACSTSLVALHLACQSLRAGECDLAVAGGVSIGVPRKRGYVYTDGGILSRDGHCRPFDAAASGTVAGEGASVLVLRRLSDALRGGDSVKAVVLGSAINNDGSTKVGYTAPSVEGQAGVIAEALRKASLTASRLSYVETHGTGTALGDPIEIAALKEVFGADLENESEKTCGIGSLKSNVGHLDAAAGAASVIKTVLALENEELPPSLHFERPSPKLGLESSPFYVVDSLRGWKRAPGDAPRRAGVSSFGIGGTNAHVILEEAPETKPSSVSPRSHQLLLMSARSETSLSRLTTSLAHHLERHRELDLADVAFTLSVGRKRFAHRALALCTGSVGDAARALGTPSEVKTRFETEEGRRVAYVFPGQGTQYVNMGRELYFSEAVFRDVVDEGSAILRRSLGRDLRDLLFPEEGGEEAASQALAETQVTQPVLFLVQFALSELLRSWGLSPEALIGHSIGEYTAACVSGVFDFDTGLEIAAKRGRLMQSAARGAMTSVALSESDLAARLGSGRGLAVAAVNGDALTVVSGSPAGIEALERELELERISVRRLPTSHAFHSSLMEPVVDRFASELSAIELKEPKIPFVSNVTGTWIRPSEARDPAYWARHLRETVRFAPGVRTLLAGSSRAVIELGRGGLSGALRGEAPLVVSLLGGDAASDGRTVALSIGRLWQSGVDVDWDGYYGRERRRRVALPTYPFERERYWIEHPRARKAPDATGPTSAGAVTRAPIDDWIYAPVWRSTRATPETRSVSGTRWLVLEDEIGLADRILKELEGREARVVRVRVADSFCRLGENLFGARPEADEDYAALAEELDRSGLRPDHVVHLWSVEGARDSRDSSTSPADRLELQTRLGFVSLVKLAQSLTNRGRSIGSAFSLTVVTANLHEVGGETRLAPEGAPALGIVRVLPQEHPGIRARNVDVSIPLGLDERALGHLAEELAKEVTEEARAVDPVVALRGRHRFVPELERVAPPPAGTPRFRTGGVYWITGGLGKVGLAIAEHLARRYEAKLVLSGRSEVPPKDSWTTRGGAYARLRALEGEGASILALSADVRDAAALVSVVEQTYATFGRLDGVIHAAGTTSGPAFRPVHELQESDWQTFFEAKVRGTLALDAALRGLASECDFVLLMSSLSTQLGGLGFSAYAAANAFMDHFALARSRESGTRWMSVAWDGFHFERERDGVAPSPSLGRTVNELAMAPDEAIEALERLLRVPGLPTVVVSTSDPAARLALWKRSAPEAQREASASLAESASSTGSRPSSLSTPYRAPASEIERSVVTVWENVLGIQGVGLDDDFFELGGHSLSALQIVSAVSDRFAVEIPVHRLFQAPTAASVAALVRSARSETPSASVETLLESVESMSEEEARELLGAAARDLEADRDE